MTEIYVIRHGQASFGAEDYDVLSALGERQARWLGEHFKARGIRPGRVIHGSLKRQADTAEQIRLGLGIDKADWPEPEIHEGLNEYDSDALVANWGGLHPRSDHGDRKGHFRELIKILGAWQAGEAEGAEPWTAFRDRVADAIRVAAQQTGAEGPVFVSTSGGVIGEVIRQVLDAPPPTWIRVHMQVRNAGYSRLIAGRSGVSVASFNETPHLEMREGAVSYS
ncbi:histidine phosphatase family protein [Rhodovulum sp. DZ06]|uniref:histidine phosphatase family protein n=1 Tax=Rhodovulum sp. DZ06 TaxID=3425126 RepID=UPI003D32A98B